MNARRLASWLDHASVVVPDLADAVERLDRRLGMHATVSPAAPERHSRVYLHRSYLEVSARDGQAGWEATMFFLRFDDAEVLRAHLDDAGIEYRFGGYVGVDGTWDDVEIRVGAVALPTLIRRTAPPEVARDWPPALGESHRCGARTLAAVHVEVPSLDEAVEAYERLLGAGVSVADRERPPGMRAHARLASGEIFLHEGRSNRILGLVLGVPSIAATRATIGGRLGRTDEGVAWVDPEETSGLQLGFTELEDAATRRSTGPN